MIRGFSVCCSRPLFSRMKMIISEVGCANDLVHIFNKLICTDLLEIVFPGTDSNHVTGVWLAALVGVRQMQRGVLLSHFFCPTVKHRYA